MMPGFDGTGPNGRGSMTGRGMGQCGRGRGLGRCFYARTITKDEERTALKSEKEAIDKRLKELEE